MSPHMSPLVKPSDAAGLLQSAGFTLPTVDVDTIKVAYPHAITLMEHLYKMGEGAAANNRTFNVGRDVFLAAVSKYQEKYGVKEGNEEEYVTATYQVLLYIYFFLSQ